MILICQTMSRKFEAMVFAGNHVSFRANRHAIGANAGIAKLHALRHVRGPALPSAPSVVFTRSALKAWQPVFNGRGT